MYIRVDPDPSSLSPNPVDVQETIILSFDVYEFIPLDTWEWDPFNFKTDEVPIRRE